MVVKAQPIIEIDNTPVSCGAADLGIAPVVMDDLSIRWGREDYFSHTEPAQLSFRIWDSTGVWAERIRARSAIGAEVTAYWNGPAGRNILFRGSISSATATRTTRRDFKNRYQWEIRFIAMDPIAALGNVFPVPGVLGYPNRWTMEERKEWLKGLFNYGGVKVNEIEYVDLYRDAPTKIQPVGEDSALDLLEEFYASQSNDTWTYDAQVNRVKQVQRLDGEFTTFLASYDDSRGAVLISAGDHTPATQTDPRPGIALSACSLGVPEGLEVEATPTTALNSVEARWEERALDKDGREIYEDRTLFSRQQVLGEPLRTLAFDTLFTTYAPVKLSLDSAWYRAQEEGALPRHAPISYRAGKEFPTERVAKWWLTPWENARPGFINGDALHSWLSGDTTAWPPLVSPVGGEIHWDGADGWTIENRIAWIWDHTPVTPMAWKNLQQLKWSTYTEPVPWWWDLLGYPRPKPVPVGTPTPERDVYWGPPDADGRQYRFEESVSWGDLRYLDDSSREIKDVLQ